MNVWKYKFLICSCAFNLKNIIVHARSINRYSIDLQNNDKMMRLVRMFRIYSSFKFNGMRSKKALPHTTLLAFSLVKVLGFKEDHKSELLKIIDKARQLLKEGDVENAVKELNTGLKKAEKLNSTDDDVYSVKEQLAVVAVETKHYAEAEKLFLDVLAYLSQKGLSEDDTKIVYITYKLGEIYRNLNMFDKSKERYSTCYSALKPKITNALKHKHGETVVLWIMVLIGNAYYNLDTSNLDVAYQYFKEAYDVSLQFHGDVSEQSVLLLKDLGVVCYQKGEIDQAFEYLKRAVDIGKHLPQMKELSSVYISLGNIYLRQGLLKEAETQCNQGYKNAVRHHFESAVKEANTCLEEIKRTLD